MSMYNMINKMNPCVFFALPVLGQHPDAYPRFRDCFIGDPDHPEHEERIIIYTRTGGGNRESYAEENAKMRFHENFVTDYDDAFDSTYACWVFDIPEQWREDVFKCIQGEGKDTSKAYQDLIANTYPKIEGQIRELFAGGDVDTP